MKAKKSSLILSDLSHHLLGAKTNYKLRYYHQRGHWPNLKHPSDISEYLINNLFTPERTEYLSQFVDKVNVRNFIKEKGLESILLNIYGIWDRPEDIDFESLPNKFILKSNNGCGNHVICRDKKVFDISNAIDILNNAIEMGKKNVEPHYHYIQPKVYCEELIETPNKELPVDYKFTCINGEIVDVFVATERAVNTKYCTLNLDWEPLPYTKPEYLPKEMPAKPKHLDKLIEVARVLSKDFDFVRVDLYEYRDQPYFSELTFFPWGALLYSYTDDAVKLYWEKLNGGRK